MPLLLVALAALLAAAPAFAQPTVRVRLLEREAPTTVTVGADRAPVEVRVGPALLGTLAPGSRATVRRQGASLSVEFGHVRETATALRFVPRDAAPLRIRAGSVNRTYRGSLAVETEGRAMRLVNAVGLEDYVTSVVASEYPFPEIEGVKAQAVLARTYALKARGKYGAYDVVDHVGSQVYRGADVETPVARQAAEATAGEVLSHDGALIEALYSSSSGGHTADNDAVWRGEPLPYLRGRTDPFDHASPDRAWTATVERAALLRALSKRFGGRVTGISIAETSREGRVSHLHLHGLGRTVSANDVRLAINAAFGPRLVRSTFFTLRRLGDRYEFEGRGFGHGVGLSQYGAREQARQGKDYRSILAFYFDGTLLAQHDALPPAGAAPASPLPSSPVVAAPPRGAVAPIPARPASTDAPPRPVRVGW